MNRQQLEEKYGKVWNTAELQQEFSVQGFSMGLVVVAQRDTQKVGSLSFQHDPRFYYDFVEHDTHVSGSRVH